MPKKRPICIGVCEFRVGDGGVGTGACTCVD